MSEKNNSLQNLDWNHITDSLKKYCTCETARTLAIQTSPLLSIQDAELSFYEIDSATQLILSGIRPFAESLDLFETWATRLRKNAVLKPIELKDVRHFCMEVIALKTALNEQGTPWAITQAEKLCQATAPLTAIDHLITPSADIRMDASERLYRLFKEKDSLAKQIQTKLDRLVKDFDIEHMLQEKYVTTRDGRWVIPVKGGLKHYVPGVVHGSSQTKQTVYIEPEITIPMNNRLREIDVEIEDEIEKLLTEMTSYLYTLKDDFESSKKALLETDLILAKAQLALQLEAKPCHFNDDTVSLKDLYHPVLKLSGKNPVTNTVELNHKKRLLILSGPNAGGKTVLLKSVGLACQMARCGLPICASYDSTLPFFKDILISIGDSQNVDEDLSTFAAHLKTLNEALKFKGPHSLILIDEICGSTDPEEGSALARSFIQNYAVNEVFGIITSHLSPLKRGWDNEGPIQNGSLEYDSQSGRPTYNFLSGLPGNSLALLTAKRVGIDDHIIKQAASFLSPESQKKLNELEDIENLKKDILKLQDHFKQQTKDLQKKQEKLDQELKNFEITKDKELEKFIKNATKNVDEVISKTKAQHTLDKHRKLQEIKYNLPEIVKASSVSQINQLTTADQFSEKFPPGSKVFVTSLNQDGIVQSTPNAKGEILVLSQSIRLQVHWTALKPAVKLNNPTGQMLKKNNLSTVLLPDSDQTLDLRGKSIDTALSELEIALDRASVNQQDRLKIIHGHGTDALKKAIRTYLSRSVYVKKWKAGTPDNGGDGITWVEIGTV